MFYSKTDEGFVEVVPGVKLKALAWGDKTLLAEFRLKKGNMLPRHAHLYEQTGYLVSGRLRLTVGEEVFDASPGDSWCIPGHVEHQAEILEDSVATETFSPLREDYLPGNLK